MDKRQRPYSIFDAGTDHNYFDAPDGSRTSNRDILLKVAEKSYIPTNEYLMRIIETYPEFRLSISITGTIIEQFERLSLIHI